MYHRHKFSLFQKLPSHAKKIAIAVSTRLSWAAVESPATRNPAKTSRAISTVIALPLCLLAQTLMAIRTRSEAFNCSACANISTRLRSLSSIRMSVSTRRECVTSDFHLKAIIPILCVVLAECVILGILGIGCTAYLVYLLCLSFVAPVRTDPKKCLKRQYKSTLLSFCTSIVQTLFSDRSSNFAVQRVLPTFYPGIIINFRRSK
jgi:hypothetical protein